MRGSRLGVLANQLKGLRSDVRARALVTGAIDVERLRLLVVGAVLRSPYPRSRRIYRLGVSLATVTAAVSLELLTGAAIPLL